MGQEAALNYQLGHRGWEVSELKIPVYIVLSLIFVLVFLRVRSLWQFDYPPKYGEYKSRPSTDGALSSGIY